MKAVCSLSAPNQHVTDVQSSGEIHVTFPELLPTRLNTAWLLKRQLDHSYFLVYFETEFYYVVLTDLKLFM